MNLHMKQKSKRKLQICSTRAVARSPRLLTLPEAAQGWSRCTQKEAALSRTEVSFRNRNPSIRNYGDSAGQSLQYSEDLIDGCVDWPSCVDLVVSRLP